MKIFVSFMIFLFMANLVFSEDRGVVIVAKLERGRASYEVDGVERDLDGVVDILRIRAKKMNIPPEKDIALVLADKGLNVNEIEALRSALSAYGFLEIRVFLFSSDMRNLQELSFSKNPIRFTKNAIELMRINQEN